MEASCGPVGEPVRRRGSVWERVVTARARIGGSRGPREGVRAPAGVRGGGPVKEKKFGTWKV